MSTSDVALQILGTGEYVPSRRVQSTELDQRLGKAEGWTCEQTGVESRAFTGPGEDVVKMGAAAAAMALDRAGLRGSELDAIIAVGSVPAQAIPCTAALLQRELRLSEAGIPAFDVNATCLGFLVALDLVAQSIATGRYRSVLIVASERPSAGLDWDDPLTAGLFGDGAGAVVIGAARRQGPAVLGSHFRTYSEGASYCQIRAGGTLLHPHADLDSFLKGTYFEMRGRHLYRMAAELLPEVIATLLERASAKVEDIDLWVPHQASGHAISHLQSALGLPPDRIVLTLGTHGNQIAASLPIALHSAMASNRIREGSVVALIGTGAGLSFGGAVLRF